MAVNSNEVLLFIILASVLWGQECYCARLKEHDRCWWIGSSDDWHHALVSICSGCQGYGGTFFDPDLNEYEQRYNSSFGLSTVFDNEKVDAVDEKLQEINQPEVLFQEGRSFCISGEHFKNSETLMNYPPFDAIKPMIEVNFDIGSHIRPDDYQQMNTFPWEYFDKSNRPKYPFNDGTSIPGYEKVFYWENATKNFFHTSLIHPNRNYRVRNYNGWKPLEVPDRRELPPNSGFFNRPAASFGMQPSAACRNPYFIGVTEIEVNGVRLHNWLHITLFTRRSVHKQNAGIKNCPTGRIRWVMLEVRDSLGLPIGDFNTEVPCSCKCQTSVDFEDAAFPQCKQIYGTKRNALPCMYTPMRAITQPGLFLFGVPKDKEFTELHVNWHFAQHTSYFAKELHFAALVVEDDTESDYYTSRQTKYEDPGQCVQVATSIFSGSSCDGLSYGPDWMFGETMPYREQNWWRVKADCQSNDVSKAVRISDQVYVDWRNITPGYYSFSLQHTTSYTRPYGWTAQYKMLEPQLTTLGGWDPFNPIGMHSVRINCHKKIDNRFYKDRTYKESKLPKRKDMFRWNSSYELYRTDDPVHYGIDYVVNSTHAIALSENDTANFFSVYQLEDLSVETVLDSGEIASVSSFFFGTSYTANAYQGYDLPDGLKNLQTMENISLEERCGCPAYGTTEDPDKVTKSMQVLQGRSTHATQMLLAWVVLVPIALLVIRYYKETYMRVFLLHEYWWYSVHFMCLATALLFMIGGILSVEYKKIDGKVNWDDVTVAHVTLGSASGILFVLHLFLGPFRFYWLPLRELQITLHCVFGVLEYCLAVSSIIAAAWIPQGRMPCGAFVTYMVFLIFQALVYIFMETHMRYVDNMLGLQPQRQYYPVPSVRVFHRNAPLSKFRAIFLGIYAVICWLFYILLRIQIQQAGASCFADLGNDYEEEIYENF